MNRRKGEWHHPCNYHSSRRRDAGAEARSTQMSLFSRVTSGVAALALGATLAAGCATARGAKQDAETAGKAVQGAAELQTTFASVR